jgi:hypothetical protein
MIFKEEIPGYSGANMKPKNMFCGEYTELFQCQSVN